MRLIGCRRARRHPRCRGGFVVMPEGGSGPGVPAQGPPPRPQPSPRTGSPACPWQPGLPAALCPWHSHLSAPWICQVWPRGAPGEPRSHRAPFAPVPSSPASALPCPVAFFRLSVTVLVPFRLLHSGEISASTRVLHHLHPVSPCLTHSGCSKLRHSAQRAPGCYFTKLQHFPLFPFLQTNALLSLPNTSILLPGGPSPGPAGTC